MGVDPETSIYKVAFCWSTQCPALRSLGGDSLRIWINQMPVTPATGPDGLAGRPIVLTTLHPTCAKPTSTITLQNGQGTFILGTAQRLMTIPQPGIDTLDIDVKAEPGCGDEWVVVAFVPVPTADVTTPEIPPAACPCWGRTLNGTCPGIMVPITLEALGVDPDVVPESERKIVQCIDPANYDVYTGRMAYSYCWRYACLPPVFATTRFKATCSRLERWNIGRMRGQFTVRMQRTEGLHINVTGHSRANPGDGDVLYTQDDDEALVTLPERGFTSMTFEYIVPPGFDDLSAAVVFDSQYRPPPPPSPPYQPGTTCGCPLTPLETAGGSATQCNSTYATMKVWVANDSTITPVLHCVPYPNYDVFRGQLAFSHCWRYTCLPAEYFGKSYYMEITEVTTHNIADIPAANYELIFFPAPYGMLIEYSMIPNTGQPTTYNSTVGGLVINGRRQTVPVPAGGLRALTIRYYVPNIFGIDGRSAAVVMRYLSGTAPPSPPRPPALPPAPPSPPPAPYGTTTTFVATDFMVVARIPVEQIMGANVNFTGYYVTVPIEFYDYSIVKSCDDSALKGLKTSLAAQLKIDANTITLSCRYVTDDDAPIARRMLIATRDFMLRLLGRSSAPAVDRRELQDTTGDYGSASTSKSAKVELSFTSASSTTINPKDYAVNMCATLASTPGFSDINCKSAEFASATRVTYTKVLSSSDAAASQSSDDLCGSAQAEAQLALQRMGVAATDMSPVVCTTTKRTLTDPSLEGSGTGGTGGVGGNNSTEGGGTGDNGSGTRDVSSGSSASSGLAAGAIAGIVIGAVAGAAIIAVIAVTVYIKVKQSHLSYVDPTAPGRRGASRWLPYSMQQKQDAARAGAAPIAGVTEYT